MRKPSLAFLVAALAVVAVPRAGSAGPDSTRLARDPEIWVVIGREQADELEMFLGREKLASLLTVTEGNDVAQLARTRESRLGDLAAAIHARFKRCGGFTAHETRAAALAALDAAARPPAPEVVDYSIDNGPTVRALIAPMAADNVKSTIQSLSSYATRYYTSTTGVQAAQWLRDRWVGYAAGRGDVRVFLWSHTWAQPSVVARIQGTQFPNEAIVIGGHLDSTSSSGNAPGADDNASGVASLTETFRAAMATGYRPARTVFFMAYAAEEVGLRGSQAIATAFASPTMRYKVVGKLQFDMTNYKRPTSAVDIGFLTEIGAPTPQTSHTNLAQTQFLVSLVTTYAQDIVPGSGASHDATTACGYACSDHAPWNDRGIPSSIAFESKFGDHSPYIHTSNDTLANSDPTAAHAVKFSKLGAAYMAELAKGTIVPPLTEESARRR